MPNAVLNEFATGRSKYFVTLLYKIGSIGDRILIWQILVEPCFKVGGYRPISTNSFPTSQEPKSVWYANRNHRAKAAKPLFRGEVLRRSRWQSSFGGQTLESDEESLPPVSGCKSPPFFLNLGKFEKVAKIFTHAFLLEDMIHQLRNLDLCMVEVLMPQFFSFLVFQNHWQKTSPLNSLGFMEPNFDRNATLRSLTCRMDLGLRSCC